MFIIKVVEHTPSDRELLFEAIDPNWRWIIKEDEFRDYQKTHEIYGMDSKEEIPKKSLAVSFGALDHDRAWSHLMPVEGFVAVHATVYIMNQDGKTIEKIRVQSREV